MTGIGNDALLWEAQEFLQLGQLEHAVDLLCELLGRDPNHPHAHALLAMALVDQGRLHAAQHEVDSALALAPDDAYCHYAAAIVAMVRTRFREAHGHIDQALARDPGDATFHAARARVLLLEQRWQPAAEAFQTALENDAENVEALVGLAEAYWRAGFSDHADSVLAEALRIAPAHGGALTQMGWLLLGRGDVAAAREHALWVLAGDATDTAALELLTAVKASESRFLSLWWRMNAWMMHRSDAVRIGILVGLYLAVQIGQTALTQQGEDDIAGSLQFVWVAFCIYTWVGPAMFQKQLEKELSTVRLQPDF
jgi:tetratricopeptide (TPR) repeat protein